MARSNFDFLNKPEFTSFYSACIEAESSNMLSPEFVAIASRRALELAIKWIYSIDTNIMPPYDPTLNNMLHEPTFKTLLPGDMFTRLRLIIAKGNSAVHSSGRVTPDEAKLIITNLYDFTRWVSFKYTRYPQITANFDESLLPDPDKIKQNAELMKKRQQLSARQLELKEYELAKYKAEIDDHRKAREQNEAERQKLIDANAALQAQLTTYKSEIEAKQKAETFKLEPISEKETRRIYIDNDLMDAGWILAGYKERNNHPTANCLTEVPVIGMPTTSGKGHVDYVLYYDDGTPLAVVEAKKSSKSMNEGKQQAKLYADCIEKDCGVRPLIFYTNGVEIAFWDDTDGGFPPRTLSGFHSKEDLYRRFTQKNSRKPLSTTLINENITDRYYQKEAAQAVFNSFASNQRKALLVMATGTGKTRTIISIIDVLERQGWIKNVLFLTDRISLITQTIKAFKHSLGHNISVCNLLTDKVNTKSRYVFSTYQTMMNCIDNTRINDHKLFNVGYFDLVVVDEAHRSVYNKYKEVFYYFDSYLVGLTATPKDEINKNTYSVFDLPDGLPTYNYSLEQAISDKYLVKYNTVEASTKIMLEGIIPANLSPEELEEYEDKFGYTDDNGNFIVPDMIPADEINRKVINADTIDKVLIQLMKEGLKVEGGTKLGKTIIFATNIKHAKAIVDRFDILFPEWAGRFCMEIHNQINFAETLIESFADVKYYPQIAVSVDMLDTGIDVPEIVNLVFFKKVMSPIKLEQMKGRGTRLRKNLFGPGLDKKFFYIFDYCGNLKADLKEDDIKVQESIIAQNFKRRVELVRTLQHLKFSDDAHQNYRNELIDGLVADISTINKQSFLVKKHLEAIEKFSDRKSWTDITALSKDTLSKLAGLIPNTEDDEHAIRLDGTIYQLQLDKLSGKKIDGKVDGLVDIFNIIASKGSINQVKAKKDDVTLATDTGWWHNAKLLELDKSRKSLRTLVQYAKNDLLPSSVIYTNIADELVGVIRDIPVIKSPDMPEYRHKMEELINKNYNHPVIQKIHNNQKLTDVDIEEIEGVIFAEVSKDEYSNVSKRPLSEFIRTTVGLDKEAAYKAFSDFLSVTNLTPKQSTFIKKLVEYVAHNGLIELNVFQEEPFVSIGNIVDIFNEEWIEKIVIKIKDLNAIEV